MKKTILFAAFFSILTALFGPYAYAMNGGQGENPYGTYCPGHRWGWYGAKRAVGTAEDARRILVEYFSPKGNFKIGEIRERKWFFEADIRNEGDKLIDTVIVDKRTGRIRSIY
ncbi:MAG: hypothetical protein HQL09_06480 [Nitrospirae bacterium]|nr:hypothetical protein [Nitrospirota bacterium]